MVSPPFNKMLIANRGEIAIRIMRACRELGIATVAVYAEPDRESRHLRLADQAFLLGGPNGGSYLDLAAIWAIAKEAGCDCLHPGYGFLAENAAFARGTVERGLAWIGPHAEAIARMGSKLAARAIAIQEGVPIIAGLTESVTDMAQIQAFGAAQRYPLLIKAAAGGGGRGQVVVNAESEIAAALERARREGLNYFGDDAVYVELFLERPRHVEVQVLGDKHGRVIHLGERDCTIQRRNQKLVEESPGPTIDAALRERLGQAACAVATAVGYDSVGTVEFMVEGDRFYFLEMNTRIQVEHTVTEIVYDCDLVKEMIRVAAGQPLDPTLVGRQPRGWAIQVRLNAEDPSANYRPTPGKLTRYEKPEGPGVRLDGAAYEGWTIPGAYDSMIAKLITWGADRPEAIARMRRAMAETVIEGVPTTLPLHRVIMDNATFISGDYSTRFLLDCLSDEERQQIKNAISSMNGPDESAAGGSHRRPGGQTDGQGASLPSRRTFAVEVNRQLFRVSIAEEGAPERPGGGRIALERARPQAVKSGTGAKKESNGQVLSPMMSRVVKVCVAVGDAVKAGQALVVIEAMKMESELVSPKDGAVTALNCEVGDSVEQGKVLVAIS